MKTSLSLPVVVLFFLLSGISVKAQNPDTIHVFSHKAVHLGGHGDYYGWGVFPKDTTSYRRIFLNFTLGCPGSGCSAWDYTVRIFLKYNTKVKDSTLLQAPSFTVNGGIKDTVYIKKDTTYSTYYDTNTHKTDSLANAAYTIVQYKDTNHPITASDTMKWWKANYYEYYYDSSGHITDSILVVADTTMYLKYHSYYSVYDSIVTYEIARMITPYAGYYAKSWTNPYQFDITDYASILHDSLQVDVYYDGWSDGFAATCDFQMITGIPPHKAYKIQNMWSGWFPYGNAGDPIENYLVPMTIKIDSAASAVRLRIIETGHGEDNNNCSEFCSNYQHIKINGKEHFTPAVWRDDCGLNPLYHQAGTWLYDRANWCPGSLVNPYLDDITPYVKPGKVDTIVMDMDPYISPNGGSNYIVGSNLVYYGPINFGVDASLDNILAPNTYAPFNRFNPICGKPEVVIRNTGATVLTDLDITYGAVGGTSNTYHWTGNLYFDDTALVYLPPVSFLPCSKPYTFRARVSNPNGLPDQYSANDSMSVPFTTVPNYPSKFVIQLQTNNAASEDSYFIEDDAGHIYDSKSGFANSKIYKDTVSLPNGCYHFEIDDAGKDGLSFFANSDGNGSIEFKKVSPPSIIIVFQPDFGTSMSQNFTVGAVTGIDEADQPEPNYLVYPNPASSEITISSAMQSTAAKDIHIYSSIGELVYSSHFSANTDKQTINVSGFAQGIYCVVISDTESQTVKKIMITR
ncbi:MAG TPA: peptide-N-glycosidase F-related protein [Bacteroidia bacterium]|jgi:hypothetical protein|nr:peptide-N-glycosidase F-related protein [Bacteroidia bacterium]